MKIYYNLNSKKFYTDKAYYGKRVYIADKESSNEIVTIIAFYRSWFANVSDTLDSYLPCKLLELFCDYSEQVGELIIYDIDESRLSLSEFTVKYNVRSHSFIPISGGFSFINEIVQIRFDEITYCCTDNACLILGVQESEKISEQEKVREVLEKLFQLSDTIRVDEKTKTIDFTFNNGKESELLFVGY